MSHFLPHNGCKCDLMRGSPPTREPVRPGKTFMSQFPPDSERTFDIELGNICSPA